MKDYCADQLTEFCKNNEEMFLELVVLELAFGVLLVFCHNFPKLLKVHFHVLLRNIYSYQLVFFISFIKLGFDCDSINFFFVLKLNNLACFFFFFFFFSFFNLSVFVLVFILL